MTSSGMTAPKVVEGRGKQKVLEDRHEYAVGFEFDRDKGGYLLAIKTNGELIRKQVRDMDEVRAVLRQYKNKDYGIFSDFELFGGARSLRAVHGHISARDELFLLEAEVVSNTPMIPPSKQIFMIDTGATGCVAYVQQSAYDSIRKQKGARFAEHEMADGSKVLSPLVDLVAKIKEQSVTMKNVSVLPLKVGGIPYWILGNDVLRQCTLVIMETRFTLTVHPEE